MPTNADPTTKEQSHKRGTVGAGSVGHMYQSDLYTSCWPTGLGRLARALNESMQNIFLGMLGGGCGEG